jgi:serine protease Do
MKLDKIAGLLVIILVGAFLGSASTYGVIKMISVIKAKKQAAALIYDTTAAAPNAIQTGSSTDPSDNIYDSRRNAIVRAAQDVGPAVVSISVVQTQIYRQTNPGFGADFWDYFFYGPREYRRQTHSMGSGIIINPEGYILTNDHVVRGGEDISITLTSGDQYKGKVIGSDESSDLAVLKIVANKKDFPYASLGNSDDLMIGEWAIAIGNPFGYLLDDSKPTVTVGVVSATNRDIKPQAGFKQVYRNMIQTDAAINPGNSGGALVNAKGEVIGVNAFIFTSSRGSEGIGFAIPINRAKTVIADLIKTGQVVKAWVGMRVQRITPMLAQSLNLNQKTGLIVAEVDDMSPAKQAGIHPGDAILSINEHKLERESDWEDIVNYAKVGQTISLKLTRGDDTLDINLFPEEMPIEKAPAYNDRFGLQVVGITKKVAIMYSIRDDRGVLIKGVVESGIGAGLGFQERDIIRSINRRAITNLDNYKNLVQNLRPGTQVLFVIERQGELYYLAIVV